MAENDVKIDATMDASSALSSADALSNSLHGLRNAGAELSEAFDELHLQEAFAGGNAAAGAFTIALQLGLELIRETNEALETTIESYGKALKTATDFYDRRDKENKSGNSSDRLTDSGMDAKTEAAIRELGATQMGFAATGTWTRRFQNIGSGLSDFFGGDNSDEDALREGRKIAQRQRDIEQNNKEEQDRRDFAKKAQAHNFRQEQEEYRRWQKEQLELDKKEREQEEAADVAKGRAAFSRVEEMRKQEQKRDEMAERFRKQEERSNLVVPEKEKAFTSKIESLEATYNRIQTAASSEDPLEKSRQHAKQLHDERTALMKEQHKEDLDKQDEVVKAAREAAGVG